MAEEIKKILKDAKHKATPARIVILKLFSGNCVPMSAEEIYAKVKKFKIDNVTVYRTLASFEKSGILRKVELGKDSAYFERNDNHHHHVVCLKCNKIDEFELKEDEKLVQKALKQAKNFQSISSHNFDLFGLCKSCAMV